MEFADLDSVMFVENRAYDFGWARSTFKNAMTSGQECWVVEEDHSNSSRETFGHVVFRESAGEADLLNLAVDPNRQRLGIGRTLLEHAVDRVRASGATRLNLEVRVSNLAALALYESFGFNRVGVRKDYYPSKTGRENALVLSLPIYTVGRIDELTRENH